MGKRCLICLFVCFVFFLNLGRAAFADETTTPETSAPTTAEPTEWTLPETYVDSLNTDASVISGCCTTEAQVPLRSDKLLDTGKAGILYELTSDTLVYGENMDATFYPGSFVKLMTALLAIEQGDLTQEITVTQEMLNDVPENSSVQGFLVNEVVTLEQLLYSLVVASANDAAIIIADSISGSEETFVEAMNQKAVQIGCTGTNYTNCHGVHDDQQYTTPRDLLKLMVYGLQYDMFKTLISTPQYWLAATNLSDIRRLDSTNYMMSQIIMEIYYDYRVTGGKAASNKDNERSLIITAEDGGLYYVGIVMDTVPVYSKDGYTIRTYNEFLEMKKVIDLGFDNYEVKQVLYDGQITNRFTVINGENSVAVGPTKSVMSVLPIDATINDLNLRFQRTGGTLNAPVEKGQILDILQVWYGSVCIAQSELVAMNSSKLATVSLENNTNSGELSTEGLIKALAVMGIILGVIIVFFVILYIIRFVRTAMFRSKRRKRRNSRRRSR